MNRLTTLLHPLRAPLPHSAPLFRAFSTTPVPSYPRAPRPSSPSSSRAPAHVVQVKSLHPKRDETTYGLPSPTQAARLRKNWPDREKTEATKEHAQHPLWRFFHQGVSLEVPNRAADDSGRSWTSFELRKKDFDSLHKLWYICLRERNVLLTQREEARRLRLDLGQFSMAPEKLRMVQKSMARIKQVLSERRHAALDAGRILRERGMLRQAEEVEREAGRIEESTRA